MSGRKGEGLAIVVVNYGSSALLAENLAPLAAGLPDAVVVVVDNRTDDAERARVTGLAEMHGWLTQLPASNLGFGAGVNLGATAGFAAGADQLLILNPDARIAATAVLQLLERSRAQPNAVYCPRIVRPDGSTWFNGSDLHLDDGRLRNPARRGSARVEPWLTGACLVVGRELWNRVGGFDDDYFLYWEDVDLSHRALAAGAALTLCSDVVAVHDEGGTHRDGMSVGRGKSETYYYYVIRNRLLFAAKHLGDAEYLAWSRNAWAVAREVVLQGGRRQLGRSLRPVLVAWRAVRDGRRLGEAVRARRESP